jgi:hypothetical protein
LPLDHVVLRFTTYAVLRAEKRRELYSTLLMEKVGGVNKV